MFDCVSIGDAVMDVYLTLHEASVHCKKDEKECEICLKYGEKIPVDRMDRGIGGNAINNAVGLARLGFKTALFSVHGDDEIGGVIDKTLQDEGVDSSLVIRQADAMSRYSTIINFKSERTILEYNVPHKYHMPHDFPKTSWIYVSSVGEHYEDFLGALASYVKEKKINLAFNPNNAQLNSSLESYLPLVQECKIIFMNVEEALRLCSGQAGKMLEGDKRDSGQARMTIKGLLSQIFDLGPEIVVITDGKNGSYCYDGGRYYQLGILSGPVVSATGAGDAYGSGFMGAVMKGKSVLEAMRWGSANAHSVVAKFGPQTGLLSEREINEILAKNSGFSPKEI